MDLAKILSDWMSRPSTASFIGQADRKLSQQMIVAQANCFASGLVGLGLMPGESVAVWMQSAPEIVPVFFGIQLAGGCYVPIPTNASDGDLTDIINSSGASIVIITLGYYDKYFRVEKKFRGVRHMIVDTGNASAETTLPANARTLIPMLLTGKDATMPEIEPGEKSIFYKKPAQKEAIVSERKNNRWAGALKNARKYYRESDKVFVAADLMSPDVLLLGTVWPLLSQASVFILGGDFSKSTAFYNSDNFNVVVIDGAGVERMGKALKDRMPEKILLADSSSGEVEKVGALLNKQVDEISKAVSSEGFISR